MRPFVILCIIILGGTCLRMADFDQPWHNAAHRQGLKGFGGALYSNIGRNHVRYGYVATRGAMVSGAGLHTNEELANHRYLNHPPLVGVLLSASFHVFGVSERSARLVPLLSSALAMLVLFLTIRMLAGVSVGLLATAIFATAPMAVYYGGFVEVQGTQVTLGALAIAYCYFRWHRARGRGWLVAFFLAFLVGAFLDWPIYLLAVALFLHHVVAPGRAGRRRVIWLGLPAVAVLCFAANVAYASVLSEHGLGQLLVAFTLENRGGEAAALGWSSWWSAIRDYALSMYTPPVLLLAAATIAASLIALVAKRCVPGIGFVFAFVAMGLLYTVIFRKGATLHEYWSQHLTPGLATAAALAIWGAARVFGTGRPRRIAATVIGLGLTGWLAYTSWDLFEPRIDHATSWYYVRAGKALQAMAQPHERITIIGDLGEQEIYAYYADRTIQVMNARDEFRKADFVDRIAGRWVAIPVTLIDHPLWHDKPVFEPVRQHFEDALTRVGPRSEMGPLFFFRRDKDR